MKTIKNTLNRYRWILFIYILTPFFFNFFGIGLKITIFFLITITIALILKSKLNKFKILTTIIITIIGLINFLLIVFALIPSEEPKINIEDFYKNRDNYIKILIKDSKKKLKEENAILFIPRIGIKKLRNLEDNTKIKILPKDEIIYTSKSKNLKTIISLYLWDGTIIRIFPQTSINLKKIYKNIADLPKSQTEIKVNGGSIRFRVIKTIIDNKGFNIETNDGTLIIRGTAGLVNKNPSSTLVYSDDHIIEGQTKNGIKFLVTKKQGIIFKKDNIEKIDYKQLIKILGNNIYNTLHKIRILDKKDINQYKEELLSFIKKNIKYNLTELNKLTYYKTKLLSRFSKKYKKELENYEILQLMIEGKENEISNINKLKNIIFIPLNEAIYKEKLNYLKKIASQNTETFKTFIIQKYNELIDKGKNINININEIIKQVLQK